MNKVKFILDNLPKNLRDLFVDKLIHLEGNISEESLSFYLELAKLYRKDIKNEEI